MPTGKPEQPEYHVLVDDPVEGMDLDAVMAGLDVAPAEQHALNNFSML